MDFYDWMMKKYLGKENPRGDLAYDMKHDVHGFPRGERGKESYLSYFRLRHASKECVATFERCWKSYCKEKGNPDEGHKQEGESEMDFYDWMIKKYLGKHNARGNFAQDLDWDKDTFPRGEQSKEDIISYLESQKAEPDCIELFKKCWQSYRAWLKRTEKR